MNDGGLAGSAAVNVSAANALSPVFAAVGAALAVGDLESHLVALVLRGSHAEQNGPLGQSRWTRHVVGLLASDSIPADAHLRTQDVAIIGARMALGGDAHRAAEFGALALRELARQPLPPAVRVHDDERLLLGLAAGVGIAAPHAAPTVVGVLRSRERSITYRGAVLDLWSEALTRGHTWFEGDLASRACRILGEADASRPAVTDEDRIALFWLATRALDASWQPDDDALRVVEGAVSDGHRSAIGIAASRELLPLDAAMLVDAITWSPPMAATRRSASEYALGVIDSFPACAGILATRGRKRKAFEIGDEYDVQDLFHALARPGIPDIVPEDTTPKLAGKGSRLDFTSKGARLGFEIKHVKSASHASTVREEILIDEASYQEHPYVDSVIVFISDPSRHIAPSARPAFERDLSQAVSINGRTVQYIVLVRG